MRTALSIAFSLPLVLSAALWSALPSRAQAALSPPESEARTFVQATIDDVLGILRDPAIPLEEKKNRVESIAYERFDFELISRLVLAQNWRKMSPQQQADFVDAFKKHLSATYRDTLDTFRDETISVESSRLEPKGDVTVMTLVKSPNDDTKVDYRLRKLPKGWCCIDVIIEGVSLVQNFRSQAREIISAEGTDALIQKLRNKQIQLDTRSEET